MLFRKAEVRWKGNLTKGNGRLGVGSGAVDVPYSLKSRLEDGQSATNPEELLGAAHAGCFTMALAAQLAGAGFTPTEIQTEAKVSFDKIGDSFAITRIDLQTSADVAGIDEAKAELKEVVDFRQDSDKYKNLGGRIPKGVLLVGPPGTGKTLLAKSVAFSRR